MGYSRMAKKLWTPPPGDSLTACRWFSLHVLEIPAGGLIINVWPSETFCNDLSLFLTATWRRGQHHTCFIFLQLKCFDLYITVTSSKRKKVFADLTSHSVKDIQKAKKKRNETLSSASKGKKKHTHKLNQSLPAVYCFLELFCFWISHFKLIHMGINKKNPAASQQRPGSLLLQSLKEWVREARRRWNRWTSVSFVNLVSSFLTAFCSWKRAFAIQKRFNEVWWKLRRSSIDFLLTRIYCIPPKRSALLHAAPCIVGVHTCPTHSTMIAHRAWDLP